MAEPTVITPAPKPKVKGGFVPGDPRINRLGRPRAFPELRKRVLDFLAERDDSGSRTRLDGILKRLARDDPRTLLEYGYGKVPNRIETISAGTVLVLHAHQETPSENHPADVTPETD